MDINISLLMHCNSMLETQAARIKKLSPCLWYKGFARLETVVSGIKTGLVKRRFLEFDPETTLASPQGLTLDPELQSLSVLMVSTSFYLLWKYKQVRVSKAKLSLASILMLIHPYSLQAGLIPVLFCFVLFVLYKQVSLTSYCSFLINTQKI